MKRKSKWMFRILVSVILSLGITFVTLKICGILPWSWWWITGPLWMSVLGALVVIGLFSTILIILSSKAAPKAKR